MDKFNNTPGDVRCVHCGCRQGDHRGGSPESPRHTCPPTEGFGYPAPFPRTSRGEDLAQEYSAYWLRIDAYWSSETEFQARS